MQRRCVIFFRIQRYLPPLPSVHRRPAVIVALFLASWLAAQPLRAAELTVSAAASLTQAFREIASRFEAAVPGAKVRLNFGASGALLQQIAKGAPVDVFASADLDTMDRAQAQGLVDVATRRNFAANGLVVIVPASRAVGPATLADLARPNWARVAIGLPASVPVGRYSQEALEAAGLWPAIAPKAVGATSVRQALDYVARGEADAGFVYTTDAALMPERVRMAFVVPFTRPVVYPVAPVAASRQPALARRFVEFVAGPAGQAVLRRHGFGSP